MNDPLSFKTRREFLRTTMLGGALSWTVPSFLAQTFSAMQAEAADSARQVATGKDATILVVLQMAGGNDGLNTVVPFTNDHYYKARPKLAVSPKNVLKINDSFGFHPAMAGFKELFDAGQLTILHGVGYPNPNRSHFRSTEIWHTASDANKTEKYGWLGRYFDNACSGCDPTIGVNIGRQTPQAFVAKTPTGVSLDNPGNYRFMDTDVPEEDEIAMSEKSYRELNARDKSMVGNTETDSGASIGAIGGPSAFTGSALEFLERAALDAQISSDKILAISNKVTNKAAYPPSRLGNSLKLVARLIGGGLSTRVFYVSQGGYDTHTNQIPAQQRLLDELAGSVKAFMDDMKAQGNTERVLLMTFSEFGRRVSENANNGTDHGAAAPMFLVSSKAKAGFVGEQPSLAPGDLNNGDLKFSTDFRSVYAAVLENWLRMPSAPILGKAVQPLSCI